MTFSAGISDTSTIVLLWEETRLPAKAKLHFLLSSNRPLQKKENEHPFWLRDTCDDGERRCCAGRGLRLHAAFDSSAQSILPLPLFVLGTIHEPNKQIHRLAEASNFAFASEARQGSLKLLRHLIPLTLLASKVICCQLAGLIGMESRQSSGRKRGVPTHAHLAGEQGVELTHILCWGLSKKKSFIADGPSDWRSSLGSKGSRQSASSTQNLASEQIPQKT